MSSAVFLSYVQDGKGLLEPLSPHPHQPTGDDRQHSRAWFRNNTCHSEADTAGLLGWIGSGEVRRRQVSGMAGPRAAENTGNAVGEQILDPLENVSALVEGAVSTKRLAIGADVGQVVQAVV